MYYIYDIYIFFCDCRIAILWCSVNGFEAQSSDFLLGNMALRRPNAISLSLKYLRASVFLQVSIFQLVSGNDDLI